VVSSSVATVAEYLATLPPERRKVVAEMRQFVRQHLPKGYREAMGFGMICYQLPLAACPKTSNGKPLMYVALAAQKSNYALYLTCAYLDEARAERLRQAWTAMGRRPDMGKSCLRFKSISELPLEAIGREIASTPPAEFVQRHEAGRA
jgi:hypothetical protein